MAHRREIRPILKFKDHQYKLIMELAKDMSTSPARVITDLITTGLMMVCVPDAEESLVDEFLKEEGEKWE